METDTESESDEDMEMEEPLVFEVSEIDLEYEFEAARWHDFTREELETESRVAELWFESAQSYPPSPFTRKLLMIEEVSDDKTEPSSLKSEDGEVTADVIMESDREIKEQPDDVNETGNVVRSEVFTFIHGGSSLKKDPNQSLHKGPTFSNRIHSDKLRSQTKSSTRPTPRSSTLMKPTASQLAKQDSVRHRMQVKEKSLFPSSASEVQATKRQKLDGGLLHKVAATTQEMSFVHKAVKKITVPQEPDFATSARANRIRHRNDATIEQDSGSVYRFKARPFNRKIFEAPSLPIRKKSTPKLPEFQEFHLKTSERAMQHSSAVSIGNHHYRKRSDDKADVTALLDGVNREPRRPRAVETPKDDDRKQFLKARPLDNKMVSSRRDIGFFRKSKRETEVPLPTDLFSKLSIKSELQPNNGSRLRFPQPEQEKGSKENRLNSFQAGNERTSSVTGKQHGLWTTRRSVGIR
ncbi:unnamed protein product [Microthlaspi erraticum]|uniref:TPX2 central domain-containing protein n=1 Tax=Microthlaspi erraticum TaxID=1685480 RepID=A0A6D2HS25_9BRAS|nr:unnamed protein product [Microthlaspi erraticum]